MSTTFQQSVSTMVVGYLNYVWSNAANWTNGAPVDGGEVVFNVAGGGNPSAYDDIANLYLASLSLPQGYISVEGTLEIANLSLGVSAFGGINASTLAGNSSAALIIDGLANASTWSEIGADGVGAVTTVRSSTDPGEVYEVSDGGEVVLDATPNAASQYSFSNYVVPGMVSTFAFASPSATIASAFYNVAAGDAIALPGSFVSSVTFGAKSMTVVTSLGTTVFSDVNYLNNQAPTGYTVSTDAATGLQRITLTASSTTTFAQTTATTIGSYAFYNWSPAANWSNGLPANGGKVVFNVTTGGNPSGYDDIASLYLDQLTLSHGYLAVGGALTISALSFGAGNNGFLSLYSDTINGAASATLTIDSLNASTAWGSLGAIGGGAFTDVVATADPGVNYLVNEGGELALSAAPNAASTFTYEDSGSPQGAFAFLAPGGTVASQLSGVAIGDSIALPGTSVTSVVYGTNSLTVVTNAGTTTFSNVTYSGVKPTEFTAATDPLTGLERITFAVAPSPDAYDGGLTSDILLQNSAGTLVDWIVSNGAITAGNNLGTEPGWSVAGTGDFNGDGTADILLQNGGTIVDWSMKNGVVSGAAVTGNTSGYNIVGTGDFSGNGTSDILLQNSSGALVDWMMGNGAVTSGNYLGTAAGYAVVGTGDFTGNGVSDVLLENAAGTVVDWTMQNGVVSGGTVVGNASGYNIVGTGDFSGNGTTDILLQNSAGALVDWMMGNGAVTAAHYLGTEAGWTVAAIGDYTGNGVSDILLTNSGNAVDWTMQNGVVSGAALIGNTVGFGVKH